MKTAINKRRIMLTGLLISSTLPLSISSGTAVVKQGEPVELVESLNNLKELFDLAKEQGVFDKERTYEHGSR